MADRTLSVRIAQRAPFPLDAGFTCGPGEVLGIFGASGSGKTTLVRTIAGLHQPERGRVTVGDEVWLDTDTGVCLAPHRRTAGLVFQEHALFPHMTALGNVTMALGQRPARERQDAARRLLEAVGLGERLTHRPSRLSGGERQRVALARALARTPAVLLLDEPFAAVDRPTRRRLQDLVDRLRRTLDVPVVLVTHDFEDIVRLATHLLVLDGGRAAAYGPVREVTSRVDARWPADTSGRGVVFDARVTEVDRQRALGGLAFEGGQLAAPNSGLEPGAPVRVRIPAREVILATAPPEGLSLHNVLPGQVVDLAEGTDHQALVRVAVGREHVLAEVTRDAVTRLAIAPGRPIWVLIKSMSLEVTPLTGGAPRGRG